MKIKTNPACLSFLFIFLFANMGLSQQLGEQKYVPSISIHPEYEREKGPLVLVDEAHHNFHTLKGRFAPFATLLSTDGYLVKGLREKIKKSSFAEADVLVIANALHQTNYKNWILPTPSAFTGEEVRIINNWVNQGGSLLLIADHMPFPGAASDLAESFGFSFSNGYAFFKDRKRGPSDTFTPTDGLMECKIVNGRAEHEKITKVTTFTGSAFQAPEGAQPVLVFKRDAFSHETARAGALADAKKISIKGWCQGAIMDYGKGRIAVFGEAAMFTAQVVGPHKLPIGMNAPQASQNEQFILNLMHWLTKAQGYE